MDGRTEASHLRPPDHAGPPADRHALADRRFQGIPSLAVAPGGRLWATWYAGPTPAEDRNNYVVVARSDDRGATWEQCLVVDPDGPGPVRAFDPQAWVAPDGRLWIFWAQGREEPRLGPSGVWAMTAGEPDGSPVTWSAPRRLCDGVMMGKPLVLADGDWALPVSFWARREAGSAAVVASRDGGATWEERGACDVPPDVRSHDEHMLFEAGDGSLRMLVRTRYGIGESVSRDRGRTWSALEPSGIAHTSSRFFIRRLRSGRLLLVEHGPIDEPTGRSHLTAFLSEDDGATWTGGLLLDEREGVSYPDGDQAGDGMIFIVYDHARTGERAILMAAFSEQDVLAGEPASPASALRMVVSRPASAAARA